MIEVICFYFGACTVFAALLAVYTIKCDQDERRRARQRQYIRAAWKAEFQEVSIPKD